MRSLILRVFDRLASRASTKTKNIRRVGGSFDVVDVAFWNAAVEAASFYEQNLTNAIAFHNAFDMIRNGVSIANPGGLFLEFGVAGGASVTVIGEAHQGPVYGFDSFEGLPEDWHGGYRKGHFAQDGLPEVPANVTLVKGWFDETLPDFLEKHPGRIAYVNIDCDLYSSARAVLTALAGRIGPGCVIHFDEFFNYPGWKNHEYKAFVEFIHSTGFKFRYHSFLSTHQAVCIVIE